MSFSQIVPGRNLTMKNKIKKRRRRRRRIEAGVGWLVGCTLEQLFGQSVARSFAPLRSREVSE
jgi:hypothetical protein